ncbi:hypothetical protein, partial [Heyndrickxia coagulans]|uniref:hypothetical protein n=1 Tax=Heyndrickxia coagulans TaxID=1398 RepID=UPI00214D8325
MKNRNHRSGSYAIIASVVDISTPTIPISHISAEDFAQFQQYQASLKSVSISNITQPGKPTTCFVSSPNEWVIDSSASNHMTGNPSLLSSFKPNSSTSIITLADESKSRALGSGIALPISSLPLSSILHVQ